VQLTRGNAVIIAMRTAVDVQTAHAANALAAVVVEAHRLFDFVNQLFVENVQHFQKRAAARNVGDFIGFEASFGFGVFLTPYF
jgi:cobalamin biosynthesis protein CobT